MTNQKVTLTFNDTIATITANDDGMFDLNDVWRAFDLKSGKRPSDWKRDNPKIVDILELKSTRGRYGSTFGSQEALYAYVTWVDVRFYVAVVKAFTQLANGDVKSAQQTVAEVT